MKKCFFVPASIAILLSSIVWGGQPFSSGRNTRVLSDGKITMANVPDTVTHAINSSKAWPMQPFLPPRSIRWVAGPPEMSAPINPPMINLQPVPRKFPAYCPICIPVDPKNFDIAIVPVNPDIDSMGRTGQLGHAWVVVPSGNPIQHVSMRKFWFKAPLFRKPVHVPAGMKPHWDATARVSGVYAAERSTEILPFIRSHTTFDQKH